EMLHDCMLIHDDIIDKSDLRRGKPSMHAKLNKYLSGYKTRKFSGQDLGIVIADVIYALALNAFLSIKEKSNRKEEALKKFIEAAFYTGSGEFIELLLGLKNLEQVRIKDIYKVYDLKTANYTFAYPLSIGATLAGAREKQTKLLFNYGKFLGRAFQIKDDILGIFSEEKITGKSGLADLQEAKKTILIWKAFKNSGNADRKTIKRILSKKNVHRPDLIKMREIITTSGSLEYARKEIKKLQDKSYMLLDKCSIKNVYKDYLKGFSRKILNT
ncbi:MAG: polyprenyl synthetase family protein, partial [Candidatus Omnitrophica bacterium]|nr:polyprenyl synthetase family protein [Candidatus Omnitrophota bacterium]